MELVGGILYRAAGLLVTFALVGWGLARALPPAKQNETPPWVPFVALVLALGAPSAIAAWVLISLAQAQEEDLSSTQWLVAWGLCLAAPLTYFTSADFDTLQAIQNRPLWGFVPAWGALLHPIAFGLSFYSIAQWARERSAGLSPFSTRGLTLCVLLSVETAVFLGGANIPGWETASPPFTWASFAFKVAALGFALRWARWDWPSWKMTAAASLNLLGTWVFISKGWVW